MQKNFELFLSQLTQTNATLDYFTDFKKAGENISKISIKLHQLNFLLGKKDLQKAVSEIYTENPQAFEVLDILLAVRDGKNTLVLNTNAQTVTLASYFKDVVQIQAYLEESGLAHIFRNKQITNLVDYVFGVEVGLGSHGRKNRSGVNMTRAISRLFDNAGIAYKEEVHSNQIPKISSLGVDIKRFDFLIKTRKKTYFIEANYYNSAGSKPNEITRAYAEIAPKINQHTNHEFVWITDGQGWLDSKPQLQQAYQTIPRVYNLTTLPQFIGELQLEIQLH